MRSYETSRTLFGILEFICWAAIVIGGILLVVGISALTNARYGIGPQAVFAVPGLILPLAGLMGVVLVQTARAAVDTAELTGQILHVSRDQLEVSKQSLRQSEALEKGFEALKSARPLESPKADFATMQPTANNSDGAVGLSSLGSSRTNGTGSADTSVEDFEYLGRQILRRGGLYLTNEKQFETLTLAKAHIDSMTRPAALALDQKAEN